MPKKQASDPTPDNAQIARRLIELIEADLTKNIDSIIANAATRNSARFSISAKINDLDADPAVFTTISWAKHFKVKGEAVLDDPNQSTLALDRDSAA